MVVTDGGRRRLQACFVVPRRDEPVSHRHVGQREQPGAVADVIELRIREGDERPLPVQDGVIGIEVRDVGLFRRPGAVDFRTQLFHLVIVLRVGAAMQLWRP
jgi:hypothetical protein